MVIEAIPLSILLPIISECPGIHNMMICLRRNFVKIFLDFGCNIAGVELVLKTFYRI